MRAMPIKTVLAAGVAVSVMATQTLAEPLSIQEAVAIGLNRSPEMGRAQARTGAAEALRDAAKRSWFPTVEVSGGAGLRHLQNDARIDVGLSAIDEKPLYASVSLDQPLFDFGRRLTEGRSKEAELAAARSDEVGAAEQVALNLCKAYIQVLLQQRIVAAATENLTFHEALAEDVREGVARGAMSISEQQQAAERLKTARVQLIAAQTDLASARATLALFLGRSDVEVAFPPDAAAAVPATSEDAIAGAAAADPAVAAAVARYDAARHGANRAESELWPTFGLQGAYRYGKDFEGYRGLTKDAQGLVVMRWKLFDGGVTAAQIREAGSRENEAGFALAAARRDSELEARVGWQRLQAVRQRLREQEERKAIAVQVLDSYKAQFGIGRRSLLDLLDAQAALYDAQVESEVARASLILTEYALLAQVRQLNAFLGTAAQPVDPQIYGPEK